MDYAKIEARVLAHMAATCGLLLKAPRRQALYNFPVTRSGVLLDTSASPSRYPPPRPPKRWRCLSSRETIERLSTALPGLLPAEPYQVERTLKRAAMHWRDAFARDFPDRPESRRVWMGGDYIDDGTHKATPEEAAQRWSEVREALDSIERDGSAVAYVNPAYPPHTRDHGPRG